MEFLNVIGSRRSIRYFQQGRAVEREKIQTILEGARLASRAVNVPWAKAIVAYRDRLTQDEIDSLKTPFASVEFDLAPVYILWYHDMDARRVAIESSAYPSVASGTLQDIGALGPPHGWSHKYVQEVVLPEVLMPGLSAGPQRGGNADAAVAMTQGLLCAVEEGLGACLAPFNEAGAAEVFGVPDTWEPVQAMLVGYSAESPQAGGQRPRADWDKTFFLGHVDKPYPRDPAVTESMKEQGLIQEPSPIPWRSDEVRALSRGFRLPGGEPVEETA
ncbi:MAG: nitroreductase family protein [Dehalococcoidia bacterium]|jgi:nitroreductase|nr:nitroreductase family protein [Dehalococcoidia bacterium]